ncbi:MAG TPA: DUF937 domain-containing protein [Longimicrobiales bacterium]|nr:DUF937 domain-containing protein [Longimicrobiales bacterium]
MDILDTIAGPQNNAAVHQLAAQFGLKPEQAASAVGALAPALAAGLQRNLSDAAGGKGLLAALAGGHHQAYVENPATLADPATTVDGDAILGHVLGSKDVSRQVAARASQQTGIDPAILKKMLPLVAALVMGGLSKQSQAGTASGAKQGSAGLAAMLGPLLDRDRDGSVVDDVAGMIGGMLRSRGRN